MKRLFVAILAVCFLGLGACKNSLSEERKVVITKLRADLKEIKGLTKKLESTPIDSLIKICGDDLNEVQDYYSDSVTHPKDTVGYDDMMSLSDYRSSYKSMKKWKESLADRVGDVALRYQQLKDLEADLVNGVISDKDYEVGIESETRAVKAIYTEVERLPAWLEKATGRFHRHKPTVDSLLKSIDTKLKAASQS